MKWVFLLAIVLAFPGLTLLLRASPRYLLHAAFLLGVSILTLGPALWAAPVPWPGWPGPVKGLEVSFIDSVSLALIFSTKPLRIPLSVKAAFGLFCGSIVISTFAATQWMPSLFYVWQLLRAALLFVAIARLCATVERAPIALIAGLGVGLLYEAVLAVNQYRMGVERPGGNLGHSNFLGLASDFVLFPSFALMLGTRRILWPAIVLLSGLAIALVGGSRATLGLFAIGVVITLVLALRHRATPRKLAFGGLATVLLLLSAPVMIWAANQRSVESKISSDMDREAMKDAASMIIADYPFGVGANQYVIVANVGGYSQRAGVPWNTDNRAAPVHDTYYLITAELGVLGLVGFLATLGSFIALGFVNLRRKSADHSDELLPGLLATLIVVSIHIVYEWVFMDFLLHYMFAIAAGCLVGITANMRRVAKAGPVRSVPVAASHVASA